MAVLQPGKMDVTLVAYYGEKPRQIEELITEAIAELNKVLGKAFNAYSLEQIHGTIIGLEGCRAGKHIINTNYAEKRNQLRSMNLTAALEVLDDPALLPFDVTIGGFADGGQYYFTSRDVVPYLRSFSVQGSYAVAMGWPFNRGKYLKSIDSLRRAFNPANILHKYHGSADAEDNDFFFVLGNVVEENIDNIKLQEAQGRMRSLLAAHNPVNVPISRDCIRVVAYTDTKLPLKTSCSYKIEDAKQKIEEIRSLYRPIMA